jgi:hypothetical protein
MGHAEPFLFIGKAPEAKLDCSRHLASKINNVSEFDQLAGVSMIQETRELGVWSLWTGIL